jgi:tRNA A-37 threonylcarbamoyl transferase component Bud32
MVSAQASEGSTSSTIARLTGKRVWLVRVLWVCTVAIMIGLWIAGFLHSRALYAEANVDSEITPLLDQLHLAPTLVVNYWTLVDVVNLLVFVLPTLFLAWQRPSDPVTLFIAVILIAFSISDSSPFWIAITQYPRWQTLSHAVTVFAGMALLLPFIVPDGRFVPRWTIVACVANTIWWLVWGFGSDSLPGDTRLYLVVANITMGTLGMYSQLVRYREVASRTQRQQLKWFLLGIATLLAGFLIGIVLSFFITAREEFTSLDVAAYLLRDLIYVVTNILAMIAFLIAMLRYRLWEVDVVLNRSLVYGGVTVLLGIVFTGAFFALRAILQAVLGTSQETLAAVVSMGIVAGLFVPTRNRLRDLVDRRIYHININYHQAARPKPGVAVATRHLATEHLQFEQMDLIGKGGMGEVYKTHHPGLGKTVAVKILPPGLADDEMRRRFQREAETVAQLEHPNIVKVYDHGETNGTLYMVMEYIDGVDVAGFIDQNGPMLPEQVQRILADVGSALDLAHSQGLVHRDIKPANVMLEDLGSGNYRTVLMDFGLARIADVSRLTVSGGLMGTLAYIAPEQIESPSDVDGRADQYALGIMAYQMLTGKLPFKADNPLAALMAHLREPAPDACSMRSDLSWTTCSAITRAMDKIPAGRFSTVTEFAQALC